MMKNVIIGIVIRKILVSYKHIIHTISGKVSYKVNYTMLFKILLAVMFTQTVNYVTMII